jgi:hypothetical protein
MMSKVGRQEMHIDFASKPWKAITWETGKEVGGYNQY